MLSIISFTRSRLLPNSLTGAILLALSLGVVTGFLLNMVDSSLVRVHVVDGALRVLGEFLLRGLKFLVAPLVFCSLFLGVVQLADLKKLGRIGGRAFAYFVCTTVVAIVLALGVATTFSMDKGFDAAGVERTQFTVKESPGGWDLLASVVPTNILKTLVEAQMLPLLFITILIAIAATLERQAHSTQGKGEGGHAFIAVVESFSALVARLVNMVMCYAPVGVFALMARLFAKQGGAALLPLLGYMATVAFVLALHALITYGVILRFAGCRLFYVLKKMAPAISVAFSTSSSGATLPITIRCLTERLGLHQAEASLIAALGATVNMDGTAIMQAVATVFIAGVYHIDLSMWDYVTVTLMATVASIGTPGIPGAGLIMLSMVLEQVGLPVEGVAFVLGVDRLVNMCRTPVNIFGDAVVALAVAKKENALDESVYNDEKAGRS